MPDTSLTLIERLKRSDESAWERFVRLYAPLLLHWARRAGFQNADAEDLVQVVLVTVIRRLGKYERRADGSFRGWLFTVARNEARDFRTRRATGPLPTSAGIETVPAAPPDAAPDEAEYRRAVAHRALELVRCDFEPQTWSAFVAFVLNGRPAADVARELGTTPNAVYLARNRVLTRVRAELTGLLD